jgi:hypothetical protein
MEDEKKYYQSLIRAMFDTERSTMEEVSKVMKLREDMKEYRKVGEAAIEWYDIKYWFHLFQLEMGWKA